MSEKPIAGLAAAIVIAPLCAVCVLGPAVIASIFTGVAAWLGGFGAIVTASMVLIAGTAVYGFVRKRKLRGAPPQPTGEMSQ